MSLWLPVLAQMTLIFIASSVPNPPAPPAAIGDKGLHAALYFVLGALVLRALARGTWARVGVVTACVSILLATGYGVTDEFHQRFVAGRSPDPADVAADAAGAAVAAVAGLAWGILERVRHEL
jgi:VanZ family protein